MYKVKVGYNRRYYFSRKKDLEKFIAEENTKQNLKNCFENISVKPAE